MVLGSKPSSLTEDAVESCVRVLEAARDLEPDDPRYLRLEQAVAHLIKTGKKKRRNQRKRTSREVDRRLLDGASVGRDPSPEPEADRSPPLGELRNQRTCYTCKRPYRVVDSFYQMLCPPCAELNFSRRTARADLQERRALVTGGRIKIGFHCALKLLRDGASVTVTTRFPRDAVRRYAAEPDFESWRRRLTVLGLDLRHLDAVLQLTDELATGEPLDILINNAAQTVRRPPAYYSELAEAETLPLPPELQALCEDGPSKVPAVTKGRLPDFLNACRAESAPELFPPGTLDETGQPLDLRSENSWIQQVEAVDPLELVEVQVINAIVPFLLLSRLHPVLTRSRFPDRYVVNVSAVEGQFGRVRKTAHHPHTNMAKAALNMLTRTSAQALVEDGIHLCSVDTGWITDENPHPLKTLSRAKGFRTPLDVIDGAARVYDPIVRGVAGNPVHGCFLKDYEVTKW
ncbi:MAG: SDR family oxidoreductase [Acidobacteriota bacterium]